ncbi:MAG: type II secretion system F family protein [Phycisphaera sp.]|nr:type II secretion system F family protein [Phycisphaera sp.]
MPTYQFEALDQTGKPQKGTIEAVSSDDALAKIKEQGFFPTSVREKKVKKGAASKGGGAKKKGEMTISIGGVSKKLLTQFTRQLSTLQDAGLPILRSLQILQEQQKPGLMKNTLADVQNEVEGGSSLSEAMSKHPKVFDRLYYKMIAAGEVGGVLDIILQRLADFMEKAEKLKRKIVGAMIYPAVVISVAAMILTGIMIVVVPKFQEIFADFDTELPAPTQWLINFSNWISGSQEGQWIPGWALIFGSPFIIMFSTKMISKNKAGKAMVDRVKLKIPVFGSLLQMTAIAKFTRTLGTLISAGVPILEAIKITSDTVGNYVYESALEKVHDAIREGEPFAGPLRETKVVDNLVVNMIDVGEETGDLDKMLMKIADNYDDEVDVKVNALVSLLEPIMVVGLGASIGFIVIALFLPLVKLIQSVSQ